MEYINGEYTPIYTDSDSRLQVNWNTTEIYIDDKKLIKYELVTETKQYLVSED